MTHSPASQTLELPAWEHVDLLILGGTLSAVRLACLAAERGHSVRIVAPRNYAGEDAAGSFDLCCPAEISASDPWLSALLPAGDENRCPTPMELKAGLEDRLIEAGVPFLYNAHPAALARGAQNEICGAIIVSRSGWQLMPARVVVDATQSNAMGRIAAGAEAAGPYRLNWTVWGGPEPAVEGFETEAIEREMEVRGRRKVERIRGWTLTREVEQAPGTPSSLASLHDALFCGTWTPERIRWSEQPWMTRATGPAKIGTPSGLLCWNALAVSTQAAPSGSSAWELANCVINLLEAAEDALRSASTATARRIDFGPEASPLPEGLDLTAIVEPSVRPDTAGEKATLEINSLPMLAETDVVVCGGGTGGAPAGIAAAREGASTIVCENLYALGGVGTVGMISKYWHGNRVGFTAEVDAGICEIDPENHKDPHSGLWVPESKMAWFHFRLSDAGAQVWYNTLCAGATVSKNKLHGVMVATPMGFGWIRCHAAVDATGNADLARAAGAECTAIGADNVAVQGTGLPPTPPRTPYRNTDYTFIDDSDCVDTTHAFATARQKFRNEFDLSQIVDSRQRRQIVGDYALSPLDFLSDRRFPDTITVAASNFDTHGFTIHPVFTIKPPHKQELRAHVPFRCLLPRGVEGVLVTGLGISAHRDALPVVRMQPDVQNQGYAAGCAAAMSALRNVALRDLPMSELQSKLASVKILDLDEVSFEASGIITEEQLHEAVADGLDSELGLARIYADPERSIPLLKQAFLDTSSSESSLPNRRRIAQILASLGDTTGLDLLIEGIEEATWDEGWNFTGMGQFGACMSELDSWIIVLGKPHDPRIITALRHKMGQLEPDHAFSHFRAVSEAAADLGSPELAPDLARLLRLNGIMGHAHTELKSVRNSVPESTIDTSTRNNALRELSIARALFLCGDVEDLGREVLETYRRDLRGHFSRHAAAVLARRA